MSRVKRHKPRSVRAAAAASLLGGAGLLISFGASSASAQTRPSSRAVVGHVYVNDNAAGPNTISAFNRFANGSLVPQSGSPFEIGGAGTGVGTGSQGALQQTPDGRFILAADPGSNQISVLRVEPDGSLQPVPGGPASSDGVNPVSIAVDPVSLFGLDIVYVANGGPGANNYTGFILDGAGRLFPLPDSTVTLPDGSNPGDVLFNANGTHLIGTRVTTSLIDSFTVGPFGHLSETAGYPIPSQAPGPIGAEFRPTNPTQLFVTNAHGGTNAGSVSAFRDAPNGILTSIGSGPFADFQTAPCWVEISHDGRYLFAVNTAVPSISSYSIAPNGSLTLLGSLPLSGMTESKPVDVRLSPNGSTLYVNDAGSLAVSAFHVHGGTLAALPSSPFSLPQAASTAGAPAGLVVN